MGTGFDGAMNIPEDVREHVISKGIELTVSTTKDACESYNEMEKSGKVVAAFHLTC